MSTFFHDMSAETKILDNLFFKHLERLKFLDDLEPEALSFYHLTQS